MGKINNSVKQPTPAQSQLKAHRSGTIKNRLKKHTKNQRKIWISKENL